MPSNNYPSYNGFSPSWADVSLVISVDDGDVLKTEDFSAINSSRSLEVGEKRGASGGRVMNETVGASSQESSITFYQAGQKKLLRALLAKAPRRGNQALISRVFFDISYKYTVDGDPEIYERKLKGCRYAGDTMNTTEGTDADKVEVPIRVREIVDMIDGVECVLV
jgi:hypothetical protein